MVCLNKVLKSGINDKSIARIAQLVEHDLAKVGVAGSSPVSRSKKGKGRLARKSVKSLFSDLKIIDKSYNFIIFRERNYKPNNKDLIKGPDGGMVDTLDLKSNGP